MTLSDRDWDLLSAYADDELEADARQALEKRLVSEPDLCNAHDRIQRSKSALSNMRPRLTPPEPEIHSLGRACAIAASIMLAIGISAGTLWFINAGVSERAGDLAATDWHMEFTTKSYVVEQGGVIKLAVGAPLGFVEAPDLSTSNLVLVDVRLHQQDDGESVAMHYRGFNGCRLTLVAEPNGKPATVTTDSFLYRRWTTDKAHFSLIADTMDPDRFDAIAVFVEAQIRASEERERFAVATANATARAKPCA